MATLATIRFDGTYHESFVSAAENAWNINKAPVNCINKQLRKASPICFKFHIKNESLEDKQRLKCFWTTDKKQLQRFN